MSNNAHYRLTKINRISNFAFEAEFSDGKIFEVLHSETDYKSIEVDGTELYKAVAEPSFSQGYQLSMDENSKGKAKTLLIAFPESGVFCILPA